MRIILLGVHRMSTTKVHINNKSQTKGIRFEHDLIELVDKVRGDVSFSAWVKRAVMNRLKTEDSELFAQLLHDRNDDSMSDVEDGVHTVITLDLTEDDYKKMEVLEVIKDLAVNKRRTCAEISRTLSNLDFTNNGNKFSENQVSTILRTKLKLRNIK